MASSKSNSIHAIVGSDEGGVKAAARDLAGKLSPGGDFGAEIIDGGASGADEAAERVNSTIQALLTFPFFGGAKLVWLKNATFLGDDQTGRSETVLGALQNLLETFESGLPAGTVFLLSASPIDKRRSFYKTIQKVAKMQVIDALDTSRTGWEEAAADLARASAEARGVQLDAHSAELLAILTGGDRRQIDTEIEKIDLFLGSERRTATENDVRLLVPMSHVGAVFEIGNAIAERNVGRSLDLLERLIFHGEKEIGILLAAIIPTVRSLLLAKDLMERYRIARPSAPFTFGKQLERLPEDAIAHLPRKKDGALNTYALGLAAMNASRFATAELREALHACLAANIQLVTSGLEPKVILTQLIIRIAGGRKGSTSTN
jgi:DNA polymerase-3 subunit delta